MKRYIIILVLLMAFYPFIAGPKGCMKGSGEIGMPGEELADEQLMIDTAAPTGDQVTKGPDADLGKVLVCPDELADVAEAVCDPDNEDGTVNCYASDDLEKENPILCHYEAKAQEECPKPPEIRVPACVGIMPSSQGSFVYDYARLDEAIKGMEGLGEAFRENLTKAVDPMGLVEDMENVDSVCIACNYRDQAELNAIKLEAYTAGHPFDAWPALMKAYGMCKEILVVYSFKEGKENLLVEKFPDVPNDGGVYSFPAAIFGAQSGNNVMFGTEAFLSSGIANASSPSETFLSKNIEFYLPAGLLFHTTKDVTNVIALPGIFKIIKMYTIVMPAQTIALGAQSNAILTSIDVFGKEIKLSAGLYGEENQALVLGSSSFGIERFEALSLSAETIFNKIQAFIASEITPPPPVEE